MAARRRRVRWLAVLVLVLAAGPAGAEPFVVQVGAFADGARARALETRLRDLGHPVVVGLRPGAGERRLTAVAAGPFASREAAAAAAARLEAAGFRPYTRPAGTSPAVAGPSRTPPGPRLAAGPAGASTAAPAAPAAVPARSSPPAPSTGARRTEVSGAVSAELRWFPADPRDPAQHGNNLSLALAPEVYHAWADGRRTLRFAPFLRVDQHDSERTHADLRELIYGHAEEAWELRIGVGKVFWGVTESQHLVDIVNQTDLVENVDGEDKLGQPMVNLALVRDIGTFDLFVLPGFRERTFPGREGRLRTQPRVDPDRVSYESSRRGWHVDYAARWSHFIGDFDVGLYHFYGTSRDPRFLPGRDGAGNPVLIPRYDLIHQTGLDLQATKGRWLWKLEAIRRAGQGETYLAATGGFEYTRVGALGTAADLGLLLEYLYDDRRDRAPTPFEDDVLLGMRLALNDAPSTAVLAGVLLDVDGDARVFSLEASRRIGERWRVYLESRIWTGVSAADPSASFADDDYVQVELGRFF